MPVFAANLTMMFNEWAFLDRFDAAADVGFAAVEYLFPYEAAPEAIAERLARNNLQQALFNLPPGDWAAGERGIAALPGRFDALKADVARALDYAAATGVRRLHLMAGIADPHDEDAASSYRRSVTYAAGRLAEKGIDLLLEPINGRNMPGYFLNDFAAAERLIAESGLPNLKLQFDIYHRQIIHGDVTMALRRLLSITGHIQIASVPSRNEPDGEELNYAYLFGEIDRLGYDGFIGCEYIPRGHTLDGLGWFKPFARS
ncbi:hydroxypyruvate isomerase family protein (plasmid) [Rhizobium leguminosarum bv. trifolii]|uniref:2-oxo-tetronate isomerase n=1 Tax=Rhizobium ruizarguesonis TaxID=2081791 RepID=UPI001031FC18|nr:2-oxo-tetronate isomerase [Rhizobium ruizarguesonis]QIO47853.1 hydroxypyruvate isomerase family protein [Rhizobium leguminosarum bv. trifolii]TAT76063.1 hydroxypyruvate isomerase family protein [Rhizobium ruizarguesonis]TAY10199.1 hydroxypyruvate isomerase family protein [Rhizobium ruizarguesonis]TBC76126.1 hydroxypyruvate isomerase family protein [Rhizobium ruizarguesonis]TBD35502.1 hydroxypyruvate isomerase family protein [Rhizobium ruizarguesonis]